MGRGALNRVPVPPRMPPGVGAKRRIKGQDYAIAAIATTVRMSRAGLHQHKRPLGVFMFLGPTGVGKTELCKACDAG